MTRIDEIKKRHTEAEQQGTGSKAWEQLEIEAWRDIKYLLSKLEIAEKALDDVLTEFGYNHIEPSERLQEIEYIVQDGIKQIRE